MTPLKLVVLCLVLLLTNGACSTAPQNSNTATPASPSPVAQRVTSESVVKVSAQPVQVAAGESGETAVRITIQTGYHVNANPPTFAYLKATELELPHSPGVSLSFIVYPNPLTKTFSFAEKPLAVYEGVTDIKARLKVDKSTKPGQHDLPAKVQVQACDNQVCYAPGTLEISIPLIVK